MLKRSLAAVLFVLLTVPVHLALAASDPNDAEASKDPPLFSRMPGFHIYNYKDMEFDRYEFWVSSDKTEAVEGHSYYVDYYANEGITNPSGLQIVRNYTNAAKAIGGTLVYEYEDGGIQHVVLKVNNDKGETWTEVWAGDNGMYKVQMIQKQAMKQDVVASAAVMAEGIQATGKIAVYGIYFDTGKSDVKPESDPAVAEIVKLLKADPKLKIYVVGHTDNAGTLDYNVKLSQARAAAVVAVLTKKHGIEPSRLAPFGAGPCAPVASNASDEGKAKNRRVELVAQ